MRDTVKKETVELEIKLNAILAMLKGKEYEKALSAFERDGVSKLEKW